MIQKLRYFVIIPVVIFIFLIFYSYFFENKVNEGSFQRNFIQSSEVQAIDSFFIGSNDDFRLTKSGLWVNSRDRFTYFDNNGKLKKNIELKNVGAAPIIDFFENNDTIFYFTANSSTVRGINTKDSNYNEFFSVKFPVPIANVISARNSRNILFFEVVPKKVSLNLNKGNGNGVYNPIKNISIDQSDGSAMTYSGKAFFAGKSTVYVPFYRDTIWVFDDSVNLSSKIVPIDSKGQQLKVDKQRDGFTLNKIVKILRRGAGGDLILVASNVKSENQSLDNFKKSLTVDIYKLSTKSYLGSFYLKCNRNRSPNRISVSEDGKIALLDRDYIFIYDISKITSNLNFNEKK